MKTIWKFPLEITDSQAIEMPACAYILDVQVQQDQLCLWALVDPGKDKELRVIRIYGTGHDLPDACESFDYIGTAQQGGGLLVWHVFEE
jgi:hypothetical protein